MNFIQTIQAYPIISTSEINEVLISKALTDRGVNDVLLEYSDNFKQPIELALSDLYIQIATGVGFVNSRLLIEYPRKKILQLANDIYSKYEEPIIEDFFTIFETVSTNPVFSNIDKKQIKRFLLERGISDFDDLYSVDMKRQIDLTTADLYKIIAVSPDFSEGKLSIKFPRKELLKMADSIYSEYNELKTGTINAVHKW